MAKEVGFIEIGIFQKAILYRSTMFFINLFIMYFIVGDIQKSIMYTIFIELFTTLIYIIFDAVFIETL